MDEQKVKYAVMQSSIFVEGLGEVRSTLSSTSNGMHKGVKMTLSGSFLSAEFVGDKGVKFQCLIPTNNFKVLVLA